jgi:hypothetical protein
MLEHASMSLLLDILEILARRPARGILLAHVTEPAGELSEALTIRAFTEPVDGEMRRLDENRARKHGDAWFLENHEERS